MCVWVFLPMQHVFACPCMQWTVWVTASVLVRIHVWKPVFGDLGSRSKIEMWSVHLRSTPRRLDYFNSVYVTIM